MFLKVIACEIALREICYLAAPSPSLLELEFLTQGHHDTPQTGRAEIQKRIDEVPPARFDAILVGYGLCSNILLGLAARHTQLVVPRAHDCITFFLGSKERYRQIFDRQPGAYYYTSGWLECRERRGPDVPLWGAASLPNQMSVTRTETYEKWVKKYGAERAQYLLEAMDRWTEHYTHGVLIDFPFTESLRLAERVQAICAERRWTFEKMEGNLDLLRRWLDGTWRSEEFLIVPPGHRIVATYDDQIIAAQPLDSPTPKTCAAPHL